MKKAKQAGTWAKLEHDPRFLQRIAQARADIQAGRGVPLEKIDIDTQPGTGEKTKPAPRMVPEKKHQVETVLAAQIRYGL